MPSSAANTYRWLRTGDEAFESALRAIDKARTTLDLEIYIFSSDPPGETFRSQLVRACERGVQVRVLVDALGSVTLADSFWDPLRQAGGEVRWFNPLTLRRFQIRDHRKLLVCDREVAFIGGFNIAPEYQGDGVTRGWRDLGLQITGRLVPELAASFDEMFARADFKHRRLLRHHRVPARNSQPRPGSELLLGGPGHGRSPVGRALRGDLNRATDVRIIAAYFLPPRRLRRMITRVSRQGGRVQLITPGQSDVPLMQLATRSLYQRLLDSGVEIHEYQPQILHAKLVIIDQVVYVGSSNLDVRSLNINYELMVRSPDAGLAAEARDVFAHDLKHSRGIDAETWRRSRTFWNKLKERWAYFLFARIDPYVARRQLELMP